MEIEDPVCAAKTWDNQINKQVKVFGYHAHFDSTYTKLE